MMKNLKKITLPTCLTLVRLLCAPILVPFFIVNYVSQNNFVINILIAFIFLLFGFTDYLDGFFARKYHQQSEIGASLDHLADKFLTFSAYLALVAIGKMEYFWAILLIGREFFVMGLREFSLQNDIKVKVSSWGKLKTVSHIAFITWMILKPVKVTCCSFLYCIESVLLIISLFLSWFSAIAYFIIFYKDLKNR